VTRYEHLFNHAHHDHMVCLECGQSIEFYNSEIEALQDSAARTLGFKTLDHRLQIYGLCRACRSAKSTAH
jgi:Fur family ferric uptake transcriptional regulator